MTHTASQSFIKKNLPLLNKKGRDETGLFITEGEKFVSEIPSGWLVKYYVVSDGFAQKNSLAPYGDRASVYIAPDRLYAKLSDTLSPQGVMAVCEKKSAGFESLLTDGCLLLMCEGLADPGNIGALIRTAAAAGASGVILTNGCADLYNPKVIRASAGALFHIPCVDNIDALSAAEILIKRGVTLAAAHLKAATLPYDIDMTAAFCIIIGNEAHGLTPEISWKADFLVKIPMSAQTESLNAASAGGILLYEAVRQRLIKPSR